MKSLFVFSTLLVFLTLLPNFAFSEELKFSANVGLALPQGDASDAYESLNPYLSISGFYKLNKNLFLGARFAYIKLDPKLPDSSASIIELVPTGRFYQKSGFFGQVGLGFFRRSSKFKINGETYEGSYTDPGLNFGFGIDIGKKKGPKFEILALYNNIFTEGEDFRYISIGLGINF